MITINYHITIILLSLIGSNYYHHLPIYIGGDSNDSKMIILNTIKNEQVMEYWHSKQVSFYLAHYDNVGQPVSYWDIFHTEFVRGLDAIIDLRRLDPADPDYKKKSVALKASLPCFTPAAHLACKASGNVVEIERTGMMQLDFDYQDISEYDVEELKAAIFSYPFVGFCGLSASGRGFYALIMIAEPDRLSEYAEHCFNVFEEYGIKADRSKGKKVENLRYVSYDKNMLIRDNPEPLLIKRFQTKPAPQRKIIQTPIYDNSNTTALIRSSLKKIQDAQQGQRWATVQNVAYTLGGACDKDVLDLIKNEIHNNSAFTGEELKYCRCAEDCFAAGSLKPLSK